jgi:hypothetical protein
MRKVKEYQQNFSEYILRIPTTGIARDLSINLQEEETEIGNQRDGRINSFNAINGPGQGT